VGDHNVEGSHNSGHTTELLLPTGDSPGTTLSPMPGRVTDGRDEERLTDKMISKRARAHSNDRGLTAMPTKIRVARDMHDWERGTGEAR
jgi:hypothetical protein